MNFELLEMGYFESLTGFEAHFISGISSNANLDFLDAAIVYLREEVFQPIVKILQQGSGRIVVGSKIFLFDLCMIIGEMLRANMV